MEEVTNFGTVNGIVIYQYDFVNKEGKNIKTAKVLVSLQGMPILINTTKLTDKKVGSKVIVDVGYNGKNFVIK